MEWTYKETIAVILCLIWGAYVAYKLYKDNIEIEKAYQEYLKAREEVEVKE